jgi:hypothetical protein
VFFGSERGGGVGEEIVLFIIYFDKSTGQKRHPTLQVLFVVLTAA